MPWINTNSSVSTINSRFAQLLKHARKLVVDLSLNTDDNEKKFDGSDDYTIGVTGVLPIEHGGTGANSKEQVLETLGLSEVMVKTVDGKAPNEEGNVTLNAVPNTRKINTYTLDKDINLTATDVGARPSDWTPDATELDGILAIEHGGTGAASKSDARTNLGMSFELTENNTVLTITIND